MSTPDHRHTRRQATHGVGMAALVAKPEARSPAIVVGVEYPGGRVTDWVTTEYAVCDDPLRMHDTPEP